MAGRSTQILSVSLPPPILKEIERLARIERKSKSELIREILKWYKAWKFEKDWKKIRKMGEETRRKFGFKTEDDLFEYIHGD